MVDLQGGVKFRFSLGTREQLEIVISIDVNLSPF